MYISPKHLVSGAKDQVMLTLGKSTTNLLLDWQYDAIGEVFDRQHHCTWCCHGEYLNENTYYPFLSVPLVKYGQTFAPGSSIHLKTLIHPYVIPPQLK